MATRTKMLAAALKSRGYTIMPTRSRYVSWTKQSWFNADGKQVYLFCGTAGSCRIGTSASKSHPLRDSLKQELLAEGAKLLTRKANKVDVDKLLDF